jgi:nitrate/TMAO reductase-like tetraheme cytochrome c subunit
MWGRRGTGARAGVAAVGAVLAAASLAGIGWVVSDRLAQDNDFCNACHLPTGVPLHRELRRDFDAPAPASLAAAHARAEAAPHPDGFRCFDCHAGVGFSGRLRVKLVSARDAAVWASGDFEEPRGMRVPLGDEDCRRCHARFRPFEPASGRPRGFHQIAFHNADLGVGCVECHAVHRPGGDPTAHFVHAEPVRAQCARCHAEFEEEGT